MKYFPGIFHLHFLIWTFFPSTTVVLSPLQKEIWVSPLFLEVTTYLTFTFFFFFPTHLIVLVPAAYRQRVYSPVSCANLFLMWKLLGSEKTLRRLKSAPQLFRLILHEHKSSWNRHWAWGSHVHLFHMPLLCTVSHKPFHSPSWEALGL